MIVSKNTPKFMLTVFSIAAVLISLVLMRQSSNWPDPDENKCAAEDEVIVKVLKDSFDYSAGENVCVHIDYIVEVSR